MVCRPNSYQIQHQDDQIPDTFDHRERVTSPDLSSARLTATAKTRQRIVDTSGAYGREQDVIQKICRHENLDKYRLQSMRKAVSGGHLAFAEYHSIHSGTTYVYVTPGYEVPEGCTAYRWVQINQKPEKATVLYQVDPTGLVTEIQRWND